MKLLLSDPSFEPNYKVAHQHKLFFIGSCFAESMSTYFVERKFEVKQNPFGILFNPISLSHCLDHIVSGKKYDDITFYEQNGLFGSWYHHSNLMEPDVATLKGKLDKINADTRSYLEETNVVFVTLGTAWVYWHTDLEIVVANNLKAPLSLFEKRLLEIDEIQLALERMITSLRALHKKIKIVFTVSPVRHAKQGLVENNRSKARLLEAVHNSCSQDNTLTYFPSYEIVLDVLRDYRFYESDFVHPNKLATDYLWDVLLNRFIEPSDNVLLEELYKIRLVMQHKLRNKDSDTGRKFIQQQLDRIRVLEGKYTYLDLSIERQYFEAL